MENKKILNTIDISMFEENEFVNILLKIVELSNGKIALLNKENAEFNLSQENLRNEITSLKAQIDETTEDKLKLSQSIESLDAMLKNAHGEIDAQKSEIQTLADKNQALIVDLNKADAAIQNNDKEIENKNKKIEGLNAKIDQLGSELSKIKELIELQEGTINSQNVSLGKAHDIIDKQKIDCVKIYANMLLKLLTPRGSDDSSWNKFLEDICQKISKFIDETTTIETLSYSLKSSNSWITKISSITWWSKQAKISGIVNKNVPNINVLNEVFNDFIMSLNKVDIVIQRPHSDICENIDNYEPNLMEKANFNDLFVGFELSEGDLCEIYKLSVNGNNGLCLIYKS